jgi:hypothetical protein
MEEVFQPLRSRLESDMHSKNMKDLTASRSKLVDEARVYILSDYPQDQVCPVL